MRVLKLASSRIRSPRRARNTYESATASLVVEVVIPEKLEAPVRVLKFSGRPASSFLERPGYLR